MEASLINELKTNKDISGENFVLTVYNCTYLYNSRKGY